MLYKNCTYPYYTRARNNSPSEMLKYAYVHLDFVADYYRFL